MIQAQNNEYNLALNQAALTANTPKTTSAIDTLNFHYASLVVLSTPEASAADVWTELQLQECDTIGGAYTAVPAFTGGAAITPTTGFVIPAPAIAPNNQPAYVLNVDLRKRKRFLQLVVASPETPTVTVLALLTRQDAYPVGAAAQNVSGLVITG